MNPLLIRRRGMMAKEAVLPDGQLEWIETDGVAYITLGLTATPPRCVEARVLVPLFDGIMTSIIFGGYRTATGASTSNVSLFWMSYSSGATIANTGFTYYYNYGGSDGCPSVLASATNGTYFDFRCELRRGLQKIEVKEEGGNWVSFQKTRTETLTSNHSIVIFGGRLGSSSINNVAKSGTRLAGATKIYSGSGYTNLSYNLLPWRLNGEVGLMDTLTDTFHGNAAGSGAFTGGPNVI